MLRVKREFIDWDKVMIRLPYDGIKIEYDVESQDYYIIWRPMTVISMGKTKQEALEDLRAAAHFGVDRLIELKLNMLTVSPKTGP